MTFELERAGTLLVWILAIRSSYVENEELPADTAPFDTLQWWLGSTTSWRIRTYALDHDLHAHALTTGGADLEALAAANTLKTYGDVVRSHHRIELGDALVASSVGQAFEASGLPARIEARGPFAFWPPDQDAPYRTKSTPE
jgi:hypothetical protein